MKAKTTLEEDAQYVVKSKWQALESYAKRANRNGDLWDTTLEYKFQNGDEMTVKATLPDGESVSANDGFEYLFVKAPSDCLAFAVHDLHKLVERQRIVAWHFERWSVPGLPITLAGVQGFPQQALREYGAIKWPDGKVHPMNFDGGRDGLRIVPASLLLENEEAWLAGIRAERVAIDARELAFETGRDAFGNATCQEFFGGCPRCGKSSILNVGRSHWGFCAAHKTKWPIGANLFSDWRDETEEEWRENSKQLAEYSEEVGRLAPGEVIPEPPSDVT